MGLPMKRSHFLFQKPPRPKETYLYVGSHWLINSLGIVHNQIIDRANQKEKERNPHTVFRRTLSASCELRGISPFTKEGQPLWETGDGNIDSESLLKYYDPIP
jgi:hypothetical protein